MLSLALWMIWPQHEWKNALDPIVYQDAEISIEFSKWKNEVRTILTNNSDIPLHIANFSLNKKVNGKWMVRSHAIPDDVSNFDDIKVLGAGASCTQELDVSYDVGKLSRGHYRVVCVFYTSQELNSVDKYGVVYEFEVN